MKIEMGESLFYSWLRHIKGCQLVQTNWKPSPKWQLQNAKEIERLMRLSDQHFKNSYNYDVFKNNSLSQLLQQAEVDVLGVSWTQEKAYAVDVAYHEDGLNYGSKEETTLRIAKKLIRSAMCLRGYFNATRAEIIFASPKINPASFQLIAPIMAEVNSLFAEVGLNFSAVIILNNDFKNIVLQPIQAVSNDVADTSELFLRAYQLIKMFDEATPAPVLPKQPIGEFVREVLPKKLENGSVSDEEIKQMLDKGYSKQEFGINFPLLVRTRDKSNSVRYYATPLTIKGTQYYMCSQWFNNNRPLLENWLAKHKKSSS